MRNELSLLATMWQPTTVRQQQWAAALRRFRSVSIERRSRQTRGLATGHVVWGASVGGKTLALCWEWAELAPGVVALANPLRVLSNATLISSDGVQLPERVALLELNGAVHELDWQPEILELVERTRSRRAKAPALDAGPVDLPRAKQLQSRFLLAA